MPDCNNVCTTVALVNGDAELSGFLTSALSKAGMDVHPFCKAEDLLRKIGQDWMPGLIILDLRLPEIDGWRLCRMLRSPTFAQANGCPILVTSALYTGRDVQDISHDLGANGFLTLPCAEPELLGAVRAVLHGEPNGLQPRVLIVDDDSAMHRYVAYGLDKHGFDVCQASTPEQAKVVFDEKSPSVVLLDHHLQTSKGHDLIPHFKKPGSQVVVIAMTGDLSPDLAVEYARRGVDDFIHKPFDIKHLVSLITRAQRERALFRVEELLSERMRASRVEDARKMQTARLAFLGELMAGVAHEINNPLFAMTSAAELLVAGLEASSPNRELAEMIEQEGDRITMMIRRLLAFSKRDESEMTVQGLRDLVSNTLTLIGARLHKTGIRVLIEIPEDLPSVMCHGSQIQQVIMNLVTNAEDALNARYPVPDPEKTLRICAAAVGPSDRVLTLKVEDHGIGIQPAQLPRIFDSFYTTKASGTGLGLSIAAEIVHRHGGSIGVESCSGEYSCFTVHLPLDRDEREKDCWKEMLGRKEVLS